MDTDDNIADLGTRYATVEDIGPNSDWQCGKTWMYCDWDVMPIRSVADLIAENERNRMSDLVRNQKLLEKPEGSVNLIHSVDNSPHFHEVKKRYEFSQYIIDPASRSWPTVVRLMAAVLRFVTKCRIKCNKNLILPWYPNASNSENKAVTGKVVSALRFSPYEIHCAEHYFFWIGSRGKKLL